MSYKSIYDIYYYLPKSNCGECGMNCMKFAGFLLSRDVRTDDCPPLGNTEYDENRRHLKELLGDGVKNEITGLIVNQDRCIGCGICINVCPVHGANNHEVAMGKGPKCDDVVVMQIIDARIALVRPELCNRAIPSAPPCKACADYCPTDAMELV